MTAAEPAAAAERRAREHPHHRRQGAATDKALFHGHAVAAVAARDPHVAEDALELIEVDYELLEPVLDVREAMSDSAPIVHEELRTDVFGAGADVAGGGTDETSRLTCGVDRGDTEAAFAEADLVIECEFRTGTFHQGYIEPHASTAEWRPNGEVTIWTSTQGLFINREQTAALLGLPVSRVQVIPTEIGGGFGGKGMGGLYLEPLAAALSRKTGQTVKMAMPRAEVLMATGPTSASYSRVRIGAKRDGTLVAGEAWLAYEAGAFPGSPMRGGVRCAFASYDISNLHIDGFDVVTNKPKAAAYRAPGAPAAALAVESVINELSEELELDPAGTAAKERGRGRRQRPNRAVRAHRRARSDRDDAEPPALHLGAAWRGRRPRGRDRLLEQRGRRRKRECGGERRRHREPHPGRDGPQRHASGAGDGARGGAGDRG